MKAKFLVLVLLSMCISVLSSYAQSESYQLSSHILDINTGHPAAHVKISLYKQSSDGDWTFVEEKVTDENGRIKDFLPYTQDNRGIYKLIYHVAPYFESQKQKSFYPFIEVVFQINDENHYHVPITLSPFGYSTYRGN